MPGLTLIPALFLGVLCLGSVPAGANLRAPVSQDSPSSALAGEPGLTVLAEELTLLCREQGCWLEADYHLLAAAPGSWHLVFVLPAPGKVTVRSGSSRLLVSSRPVAWPDPRTRRSPRDKAPRLYLEPRMYQAAFELTLPAGDNLLQIRYHQDWGRDERKFQGYFSGWLTARTLRYELWPLRQWHLDPGFKLTLSVRVDNPKLEACLLRAADRTDQVPANLELLPHGEGGFFSLQRSWGPKFPARLELVTGTWEALATYGIKPPAPDTQAAPDQE